VSFTVVIARSARDEIADAVRWTAERSPDAAARWLDGLERTLDRLRELPTRCPLAPESKALGREVRQLLYGRRRNRYRILFAVRGDKVHVLHVRHGARDFLAPGDFGEDEDG
jgi:plasmid stabilization system protein ParE